jgi:uncharacterized protein (UPF0264 family)
VSAANAADARAALAGGADIVDAKDPASGPLGAVGLDTLLAIVDAVAAHRPVTAALGDARDPDALEHQARAFTSAGAGVVKVGFAGIRPDRVPVLARRAVTGAAAGGGAVMLVAYADAADAEKHAFTLLGVASEIGAAGVLLDTADKRGPSLTQLAAAQWLTRWVDDAHRAGLQAAAAGRLGSHDLPLIHRSGADVAGVRGAACDGGREGRVSASRVRDLASLCRAPVEDVA